MLPYVTEHNAEFTVKKYLDIANAQGIKSIYEMSLEEVRKAAMDTVAQLAREDIKSLAELVMADACTPAFLCHLLAY